MNSTANKKHRSDIYASTISPLVLFRPSCSSFSESSSTRYAPEEEREKIAYGEKQKAEKTSEPRKRSGILAIFLSLLSFLLADYGYEQLFFSKWPSRTPIFSSLHSANIARKKCSFASMRIVKKNRGKNDDAVEIMIQMKAPVLSRVIFDLYPRFFVRRETRLHTRAFKMAESLVGKAAQVHSYRNVQQIHIEHVDLRIGISENAKRLVIRFSDV